EVIAGVHQASGQTTARLGKLFGNEGAAHRPLAADADAREKAKRGEHPDGCGKRSEKGEERITENREHQGAHSAEPVADWSPDERTSPTYEKQSKEQSAVESDVRLISRDSGFRQELAQGGDHDKCIDE